MYSRGTFPVSLSGEVDAVCVLALSDVESALGPSDLFEDDEDVVRSPTHYWVFRSENGGEVVVEVALHPSLKVCTIIAGGRDVAEFLSSVGLPTESITWLRAKQLSGEPPIPR